MRIGLVTDIHNHAAELTLALAALHAHGVDRVVTLGDTLDPMAGQAGADEVARLLREAGAVGVWGNHDMTLCRDVPEATRARYSPEVLAFMARMAPRLEMEDCHFSHEEPWIDPHDVEAMWCFHDESFDLGRYALRSFATVAHRAIFLGHYHRWFAVTTRGPLPWDGRTPLVMEPDERYFFVVDAVFHGQCGLLDTTAGVLTPLRVCDPTPE